jgi:hypothetical protein|tara:strand:- start:229 stop:441 length:213 start_codon:yes stop_codon:yes gene_type:complete
MIRLELGGDGTQNITKVCNMCGCHIEDLQIEDIMVKQDTTLTIRDKDGNEITRKELPSDITDCKCEDCND